MMNAFERGLFVSWKTMNLAEVPTVACIVLKMVLNDRGKEKPKILSKLNLYKLKICACNVIYILKNSCK